MLRTHHSEPFHVSIDSGRVMHSLEYVDDQIINYPLIFMLVNENGILLYIAAIQSMSFYKRSRIFENLGKISFVIINQLLNAGNVSRFLVCRI